MATVKQCPYCNYTTNVVGDMRKHINEKHMDEWPELKAGRLAIIKAEGKGIGSVLVGKQ